MIKFIVIAWFTVSFPGESTTGYTFNQRLTFDNLQDCKQHIAYEKDMMEIGIQEWVAEYYGTQDVIIHEIGCLTTDKIDNLPPQKIQK